MPEPLDTPFQSLQSAILRRLAELNYLSQRMSVRAEQLHIVSIYAKGSIILLGAISGIRGTIAYVAGEKSIFSFAVFAAVGFAITLISALEAGFRVQQRASGMIVLANRSHSSSRELGAIWTHIDYDRTTGLSHEIATRATHLLDLLNDRLTEIQASAAKLGINTSYLMQHFDSKSVPPRYRPDSFA
jgi:hypothetical protein